MRKSVTRPDSTKGKPEKTNLIKPNCIQQIPMRIEETKSSSTIKSENKTLHFSVLCMLISLPIIWGTAFTLVGVAIQSMSPLWIVSSRIVLGTLLVLVYTYARGRKLPALFPKPDRAWLYCLLVGFFGVSLPFFLLSYAQQTLDSSLTGVFIAAMPLTTILLAHFFSNERLTLRKIIALVFGFTGVMILLGPVAIKSFDSADFLAQCMALAAALSYASSAIITSRIPKSIPLSSFASGTLLCGAIISTVAACVEGFPTSPPTMHAFIAVIFLGVFSTALGTIFYIYIIQNAGPGMLALTNYLTPVSAVIAGAIFLHERLPYYVFIALIIILLGLYIGRPIASRKIRKQKEIKEDIPS